MSFDDLARALAQPMPRRRALRLLGGAVAMAAVPGLGPQLARAGSKAKCGPGTESCSSNGLQLCMPTGGVCCYFTPETSGYTFGLLKGCAPGSRCGSGNPGDQCVCDGEYDFQTGRCVSAPCKGARKCGSKCCREGEVCKNAATSTCACLGGGEYCAPLNRCCDPGQRCEDGRCVSAPCKGARKCGSKCCREGEVCKNAATSTCACLGGGEYCAPLNRCCDPGQRCEDGECVRRTCRGGGKKACLKLAQDTYDLKVEKVYNYKRWSYKGPSTQKEGAEYFALSGQVQSQWTLKNSIAECEMWCTTP